MKKRNIKYKLRFMVITLIIGLTMVSCEKYLDKAPASIITEKDAFVNFNSFQGFIEVLYDAAYDYKDWGYQAWNSQTFPYNYGLADDILETATQDVDLGNYWTNYFQWSLNWTSIRRANLALANLDLLTDATQEQKDFIKGQALFWRGWCHFELMRNWGGMPYIDTLISPTDKIDRARLTYKECALKAAKDFQEAANLLPLDWDKTATGQPTFGNNQPRINKIHALSYLGKDLLYAASPMMNEASTGNATFDADLCKQAAVAFGQVLKLCDQTKRYQLLPWSDWTDNFYVKGNRDIVMNGGTEAIMLPISYNSSSYWPNSIAGVQVWGPGTNYNMSDPTNLSITHNYAKNYGMANGLPIDDPASGYNPLDPWTGREPRFYQDVVIDGDEIAPVAAAGLNRYARLFNGSPQRSLASACGNVTGYYFKRWWWLGCDSWENQFGSQTAYMPWLRLADIYLMYSEACLQGYGSAAGSDPTYGMTAEQALNVIRNRAHLPNISASYTTTKDKFMGEIIRERAVEFSMEAFARWYDLRRWNLNADPKYLNKTAIDFDRGPDGKPINLKERVVITRLISKKNNWLPIPTDQTSLFEDFPQNPGW